MRLKKYTIIYTFSDRLMGFNNSVTLLAINVDEAIKGAKNKVLETYGSGMINKFTFKPDPTRCGIVIY